MPLIVAVSLLSAAAIAYEILLTRLFNITLWHHFAYMVISLALLGYGASGTFLVFVKQRALARFGVSFAALAVSFGLAAVGGYAAAAASRGPRPGASRAGWRLRQSHHRLQQAIAGLSSAGDDE